MEQIQGTMNLYGLGYPRGAGGGAGGGSGSGGAGGAMPPPIQRSVSQNVVWNFTDREENPAPAVPAIVSPQPVRNHDMDHWASVVASTVAGSNGNGQDAAGGGGGMGGGGAGMRRETSSSSSFGIGGLSSPGPGPRRTPSAMSF
jgi:hypothetical protein